MPVALETFLSQLSSSGIVPEEKLKVVVSKKAGFADGEALARDMIKSRLLTKYQAEQILGGRGKSLTMGKYQILEKIGAGGMGQVYKAFHSNTERIVAIKVILGKGKIEPEVVKRFEREVKAAAKLVHSNIITVFDADQADGRIFMVMEYIKGNDLAEILQTRGQLGVSEVVDYMIQAAKGLKYAHDQGVIHRDIKPGNILVDPTGNVKIVDMGLAKIESKENEKKVSMLTGATAVMGTVDFMSPEQGFSSKSVDARADIYSLGATLFYLLSRDVMYPGDGIFEKLLAHRESPIPSLSNARPGVSPDLEIVFTKMVAKKLEDRYANMAEVISALSKLEMVTEGDSAGTEDKLTTHFDRGIFQKTRKVEVGITNGGKGRNKGTNSQIGVKTLAYISGFIPKTYKPKVIAVTGIIGLVFLVVLLILFMKPNANVKEDVNAQIAEAVKLKQKEPVKNKTPSKEEIADLGKGINLDLVLIPAGKFKMNNTHEVTLTKPYYMGKNEVTQEQWEVVMGNNPSRVKGAKLPVTNVSWEDCQDFIKKLNVKTSGGYRLPTEAEWEYACRAGTSTVYSVGSSLTNIDANIEGGGIKEVGSYNANAFGLYDMHGNVWECCEDWYGDYPAVGVTDPKGPLTGEKRVLRGGSFGSGASEARSSSRGNYTPSYRSGSNGFRLVRTVDIKTAVAPAIPDPKPAEVMPATGNLLVAPFTEAKAKEVQKSVAKSLQKEVEEKADLGKGINLDLVLIPAGKFKMNNTHEVTLTKPFYMGKYEVTQEQWEGVMGNNPSSRNKGVKLPVTDVSWNDCQDFIKKLNASTNGGYRLPTEAEWEYACRAGTTTAYSFGVSLTKSDANIEGGSIKEVGSYKPNAFGLYDMHGNVWERCENTHGDYPLGAVTDPKGSATAGNRVLRGGSFLEDKGSAGSSTRHGSQPTNRGFNHGFRLARSVDNKVEVVPPVLKPDPAAIMPATGNLLVAPFTEAKAKEVQKSVAKSLQKEAEETEDLGKGVKLDLVLIPAGKFMMGSPASEKGHANNETQHEVTLTKPFYMGKYEVTQEQWESVMGDNPSSTKGAKLPVTGVSWKDCQGFIEKLNAKTSGGYRRPTEAEWEYACRAGTTTAYSFGDVLTKSDANCNESGGRIKEVGSYKPNAFGFYDMHGNVWEWCEDSYGDYPAGSAIDPKGPATGGSRVARGGSFNYGVSHARSSNRGLNSPTARSDDGGFRLARSVDNKAAVASAIPNPKSAAIMPATGNLLVAPFTEAKAKEVQKSVAKSLQKEAEETQDLGKGVKLDLVLIPAGKFKMGSPASEQGRSGDETQHEVTLTKPYYVGKYEVTQEQWESVMGNNPSSRNKGAKLPVTDVSWEDCQEFIKKLNAKTNGGYRLPTESEWEYACRAGTTTAYSFGNSLTEADANFSGSSTKATKEVGSYKPNAFGLYDMHGNVWEWCDWYGDYPAGAVTDPKGPATGEKRVLRGGSFNEVGSYARSSSRGLNLPTARSYTSGLRLAKVP